MDSEEWHINYNETTDVLSHFSRFPLCDPTDRSRQQLISPTVAPRESHVIESSQFLLNPKRRIRRSCWMVLGEFFRSPSNTIFLSLHKKCANICQLSVYMLEGKQEMSDGDFIQRQAKTCRGALLKHNWSSCMLLAFRFSEASLVPQIFLHLSVVREASLSWKLHAFHP